MNEYVENGGKPDQTIIERYNADIVCIWFFLRKIRWKRFRKDGGCRRNLTSEYITEMYYNALECDVPAETFWGSSIKEVNDMIYAYNRKKKEKIKEKISMQFLLADLIRDRMITLIDDKQKEIVREWDAFPELFEKEKEEYKTEARKNNSKSIRKKSTICNGIQ